MFDKLMIGSGLLALGLWLAVAIGWVIHLVWCVKALVATTLVGDLLVKAILLGLVGVFIPFLGAVHGWVIIFAGWTFGV